ncbi:MAG: DUF427 domain-containing protein [Pseudomonadota bacterium]
MPKATWNGAVIAETDTFEEVEGNIYFPLSSVKKEYLTHSEHTSFCPWKGTANYFSIEVNGATNTDAAWIYRDPKEKAAHIKDHVAFWAGVAVER